MRKQTLVLFLVFAMLLGITAQASGPTKLPSARPNISFDGTTAVCMIYACADKSTDAISIIAKLWTGSTCLKTWSIKGSGQVRTTKTATVSKGKTYKLTMDCTINGIKQPQRSVTKTCP